MGYRSTRECIEALEKHGQLLRIADEVDPHLEMAEIQRRVYAAKGPALLFENVKGCKFPCVSNLFGTPERTRLIFADTYDQVAALVASKADPLNLLKKPGHALRAGLSALHALPKRVSASSAPVFECRGTISDLPPIVSWPDDGGAFITLPQVYSEHPDHPGKPLKSNLGMYRIQLNGNEYVTDKEVGLHYQIHRGIGVHQKLHQDQGKPFRVAIFIGGPPAMSFSAVMPLPEGMPEVAFAGLLAGRRFRYARHKEWTVAAEADFCIIGTIKQELKREGPFGDHLGYYSLAHPFPCLEVEELFHRKDAVWPFTVVGRPPQEDTTFGEVIHDMTGAVIPTEIPGLKAVHAVDAAGVHPLLLAIGQERYTPYVKTIRPSEMLTMANAVLGKGQLSLAKYLFITNEADAPGLDIHDIPAFFKHVLERIRWERDLHFQTETSIDTLDYSGDALNHGSKVVFAANGDAIRGLGTEKPDLDCTVVAPGILALASTFELETFAKQLEGLVPVERFPLVVLCDDPEFLAADFSNFLWVTFTRSNPARDIHGVGAKTEFKHWGCTGPLIIDARLKPHHAPPLIEDPAVTEKVDALFVTDGSLAML
ncbi:4-hydroxybenzoate decarboxylase subunit C [Pontiella desulfatans]|uniref:4-hydroxybenzoate decarboxylase subunit C n=1 Tax=Pontiella desulfatans TaxID=2750659 RepID=A0A6C2UAE5_PONDE|nr:UbiD family decarboxylase [Pontiella desulfatans]VGO16859.1 4-hydroxybenzoate decarboxylase subunit C [Pontiella desulfatans]